MAKDITKPIDSFYQKYFPDINDLVLRLQDEREQGKKVVLTNGCFDLIREGHTKHFAYSKSINGQDKFEPHYNPNNALVVAVNSDESIKELDRIFIMPLEERLEILSGFEAIDFLCRIDDKDIKSILEKIKPEIYTKGNDYFIDPDNPPKDTEGFERNPINQEERNIIEGYGGKIIITPYSTKKHSFDIIKKVLEKEEEFRK